MFKKLILASIAMLVSGIAIAGFWNTQFPIIGGAAYCGSTVNATCVSTIPAGPTAITGAETVPMDTNLTQGQNPQTAIATTLTLANYARGTGLLSVNGTVTAGIAGTGEQTLMTYSLPANTLVSGRMLKIRGSFTTGANGNNKTFKCYFGASVISSGTLTDNAKNGSCQLDVIWLTAASQTVYANMIHDTTAITGYVAAGTDSTAAAVTVKLTGQGGTSGVDVTANAWTVELLGQ